MGTSFGISGFSIYLFTLETIKPLIEWGFLGVGIALLFLGIASFWLKNSPGWLFCYLTFLFVTFSYMCVQEILYFAMKPQLIDDAEEPYAVKM